VLLVEDDGLYAELLTQLLKRRGHRVRTARTVAEALDAQREQPAELVVCDGLLPDGNASDLLRSLRASAPTLPIVILSGLEPRLAPALGDVLREPRTAYLRKPCALDAVLRAVNHAREP
jgi:DNA-binding NtrC family response regulator